MTSFTTSVSHRRGSVATSGDVVACFGAGPITLLAVWAHPDDESLLAGGLLAEVTRRGGRVVTVTATAGERGLTDPQFGSPTALAEWRRRELDDALGELGAEPAVHLGYGDGECERADDRLAADVIGRHIDRIAPDVILTFGPDGVTGHPDHRAVARWVRRAVADRHDRIPLLTTATARAWPADGIERLHGINAFWPGFPIAERNGDEVAIRLDDELVARKLAAISRHDSQMGAVQVALGPDGLREIAAVECYVDANRAARLNASQELTPTAA